MNDEGDIKRNFEFFYFGRDRHICPNLDILERPFRLLEGLGGKQRLNFNESGSDEIDPLFQRTFSMRMVVFEFTNVRGGLNAYYTQEERPEYPEVPMYITRIRLANYNAQDPFAKLVSQKLSELPKSDLPQDKKTQS